MAEAKGSPRNHETPASKRQAPKSTAAGETEQLVLTLNVGTGEVVNVEKIDASGQRHELTEGDIAKLAIDDVTDGLEAALEDAYETGVVDALDGDAEDLALRRVVVGRLLARGLLRHELGRDLLLQAVGRQILKRGLAKRSARY